MLCAEFENFWREMLHFQLACSRAAPWISFFGVPAKDDEYCTNKRSNIVAVIIRDTVMKAI